MSGYKDVAECYTAPVVLTTVAGIAASRVGHVRETFLELAVRDFDIVVFDESDRAQKTLDHFLCRKQVLMTISVNVLKTVAHI